MPERPFRILTAVAPYDGHDASVLALNRALLKGQVPVEVIYLGFNMTCEQICAAALQEGVDAIAVASYNGGHLHFYPYLVQALATEGAAGILVFGGGGATINPQDSIIIENAGVSKIYGLDMSLSEAAADILSRLIQKNSKTAAVQSIENVLAGAKSKDSLALARLLLLVGSPDKNLFLQAAGKNRLHKFLDGGVSSTAKLIAVTGDGGAGKSTVIDEFVQRFLDNYPDKSIAIIANDPTTVTDNVASTFLADRVRMNSIYDPRVFLHSIGTGSPYAAINPALKEMIQVLKASDFDLVMIETPGTGQTGLDLRPLGADQVVYVKTREYGGELQLQKDQLLQDADLIVLNKVDLEGAETAFKDLQAVLEQSGKENQLVGVTAKIHRDPGMDSLFGMLATKLGWQAEPVKVQRDIFQYSKKAVLVPYERRGYLSDIISKVRGYDSWAKEQIDLVRQRPGNLDRLDPESRNLLLEWPQIWQEISKQAAAKLGSKPYTITPNGLKLPKVALPEPEDRSESLRFLLEEGLPGHFPYATGIYPFQGQTGAVITRQFAGLHGPEETNQRLHLLNQDVAKPRLSIAFDGITLYGADSDSDPGSLGKIGEGGVSIDSYEDMKLLLKGFNLSEISTSMTINGPAPIILAMYMLATLELEEEKHEKLMGRSLNKREKNDLRTQVFKGLRGTVQADILKEIQAQNECIFQPEFAVKLLGDIQEFFIDNNIERFYSLSISGYHIGEAGASPIQEMAFTLANGFTYVEYFLSRGLKVDDFAPNLSFFFRVSHEAEWLAYGAVCRKIWAIAMRDRYAAAPRSQRFKFHTQTSGRALQASEWDTLNPLRQTYHALVGLLANTNSLHVDSADEPMTTPGEKYVRQAARIPSYLREEAEGFVIQNLLSGSYAFRTLMGEVQEGILSEFERLNQLGGVGPATEQGYQRRCIAENSSRYENERRIPENNSAK